MRVLIFGEANDRTAHEVGLWLHRWGVPFTQINKEDDVQIVKLSLHNRTALIRVNGHLIDLHQFDAIWHRRGYLKAPDMQRTLQTAWERYGLPMDNFLEREWRMLRDYLMQVAQPAKQLGNFKTSSVNKLRVLDMASQCGLRTPKTYVSQCTERLKKIAAQQSCITKPIGEVFSHSTGDALYQSYTTSCNEGDIAHTLQFPVLLQESIEKWVELRIFILLGKCYSMAVFSQAITQTAADYRNHSQNNKPRMVPFTLPIEISQKLIMLNNMLELNTSSVDMIITPNLQYVFLEVNPVGNIEMLSKPCNCHIEREIAKYMTQ